MTTLIAISQRVDIEPRFGERRDALDQRWWPFLSACGLIPLVLPNDPDAAPALLAAHNAVGLILTGGNDLAPYGGNAPERDATEQRAMAWAREAAKPIFGICRGLQFLTHALGGTLKRIEGHAGIRHTVRIDAVDTEVNSYHTWAIDRMPPDCTAFAVTHDGTVEGWRHDHEPISGIMWHPERETSIAPRDIGLIRTMLSVP